MGGVTVPRPPPRTPGSCWGHGPKPPPCPCPWPPSRTHTAHRLFRKSNASSASSPSASSRLSTGPGTFHGKGLSGLSGAGKSRRSASRKPGVSSAIWPLCCGAPAAMPRASGGRGAAAGVLGLRPAGRRDGQHLGLGVTVPTLCDAECPLFPASPWKPGPHRDRGSRRKGRATQLWTQLVLRPMSEGQTLMGALGGPER